MDWSPVLSECDVTTRLVMLLSRQQNSTNKLKRDFFLQQALFLFSQYKVRYFPPG